MDSDYGVPRELSEVQKKRALYQPELPPCLQVRTSPSLLLRSARAPLPASGVQICDLSGHAAPDPALSSGRIGLFRRRGADFYGSPFTYSRFVHSGSGHIAYLSICFC
jgi:hypothetical protein